MDSLIEHLSGYVEDKIELVKLEVREEIAVLVVKATIALLLGVLLVFVLFFTSVVVALYLNKLLGSAYWGFGIVASAYAALFLILLALRNSPGFQMRLERFIKKIQGS